MRYAVAVEEFQSFRVAAERCHVSQSGLSMQIQKLEDLLDTVLFDRSRKPVLITPEGEVAITQMRVVLREIERLGQVASENLEPSGRYRLGVIPTLAPTVLPLFLRDFVQKYPRVELDIEELKTQDIVEKLRADTLDAGIAATPLSVATLHETSLGHEALFAYLPSGNPLLNKRTIAQNDLNGHPLWVMQEGHCFRSQVLSYCHSPDAARPDGVRFESGSFETLMRLVDGGLGATVLPALVVQSIPAHKRRAHVRALVSPTPVREIGLVTARQAFRRRVTDALADVIKERLTRALGKGPRRPLVLDPLAPSDQ